MKVTILQGLPGSGKSTWAEAQVGAEIISADHFFVQPRTKEYKFDVAKLPEAHAACLRWFVRLVQRATPVVIVDNTNTTVAEVAPYYALAQAYGAEVEILHFDVPLATCCERQVHGVSEAGMVAMQQRLLEFYPPPWWVVRTMRAPAIQRG